jgi:hypothetical protein
MAWQVEIADNISESAIKKIIQKEYKNKKLIRNLNKEFSEKGLNEEIPTGLFEQTLQYETLTQEERIAFVKGAYEILEWEALKPQKVFSETQLVDYKVYMNADPNKNLREMILDGMTEIDELNYTGRVEYYKCDLYISNVIWKYNPKTQRASISKKIGTKDGYAREIDVNWDHVHEIADLILKGKFEDNQILINVLLTGDNNPDKHFYAKIDNYGQLVVKTHYDIEAENFTVMHILDGYHRILGAREAARRYRDKYGKEISGALDIRVVLRTTEQAVDIIEQIFKRSDTRRDFKKAIENDEYSKFIDMLGEKSSILNGQIETTYDECRIENALTYKVILKDAIKNCTKIPVEKIGKVATLTTNMANSIDTIINIIKENYFDDDFDLMRDSSFLLTPNIFVGYLAIAYRISELNKFYDYDKIAELLYCLTEDDVKDLKLKNKQYSYNNIYNYFYNLISEVIKVA